MTESLEELSRFDDLWNFGDPEGTEAEFREILPRIEAAGDPSLRLQLQTQIARTLSLRKSFDEAHSILDGVEKEMGTAAPVVRVRYLLERGRTLNSSGSPEKARPLFEEAWDLGREIGEEGFAVDAAHMVAIVAPPEEAIEWNERALDLARSSEQPRARKWMGSLLNNLGWTYHEKGDYEKALALFEEALAFRRQEGEVSRTRVARWCVARAKRSLGRTEEALAEQQDLLAEIEAAGEKDGYACEEVAECLHALGRPEEARSYFLRAYEILKDDPWLPGDEPERLERLRTLGEGA